jgi:hypothetical protein
MGSLPHMRERVLDAAAALVLFAVVVLPLGLLAWLISVLV